MVTLTPNALIADASFVLGLLGLGGSLDVVGIYNGSTGSTPQPPTGIGSIVNSLTGASNLTPLFGQMFTDARPLKATIRETSKVMEHPAETGVILSDHHIINQVEIDLPLLIPAQYYTAMYQQIKAAFINATLLTVQTRTGSYPNMIIANMPHEETPEIFDAITLLLHLKEVLFVPAPATYSPALAVNTNTVQNGLQSAVSLTSQALNAASGIASYQNLRKFL